MKILHVGIFNDHELGGDIVFERGFSQNGCKVEKFDYREFAKKYGIKELQKKLVELSKNRDLVFIGKGELIDSETLKKIQKQDVLTALWYGDIRPRIEEWLLENLKYIDYFFMSSAGKVLEEYSKNGKPRISANYFNPSDPELVKKYENQNSKKIYDIVFTGSHYSFFSKERHETINYLKRRENTQFFGYKDSKNKINKLMYKLNIGKYKQRVRGEKYIEVIKKSKIGIGVSAYNNIDFYTSDRLTHYLSFGTFFLPHKFPGLNILFEEMISYENIEDLDKKIKYYLDKEDQREDIAKKCQLKILKEYNTKNMTKMMLEIIKYNTQNIYDWVEIFKI